MRYFGFWMSVALTLSAATMTEPLACDFCMLGQGVSPYLTATGKGVTLGVDYRELDHVYDQAQNINGNGKQEAWTVFTLTAFYPLSDDLTILVTLPYSSKTNIDFDESTSSNPGTLTSGIGDITVTGRYTLFKDHTLETTLIGGLLAGVKVPTGTTNNRDAQGNPVDRHALPGTGSFDFDLGFTGSWATASGFQLTLDAAFRITTTGQWAERDHKFGDTLNAAARAFYRVAKTDAGASLLPFVGLSSEYNGEETGATNPTTGSYDPNVTNLSSGGTEVFVDIGLYAILNANTMANLGFSKAFYHNLNYNPAFDADPGENYKIDFSLTYLF